MTTLRFGRVVTLETGRAHQRADFRIGLEAISKGTGRLSYDESIEYDGDGIAFTRGDVLFGKLRPNLAKAWLADRDGEAVGDFHVYRPVRSRMTSRYLAYLVLSDPFLEPVIASVYGAKMPRADWNELRNIEVWAPDLPEQRAIADFLDRETAQIDAFIAKNEQLITLLTERRASLITRSVGATAGASGTEKLGYTCKLGNGSTPRREEARYWAGGDFPWLTSSVVNKALTTEAEEFVTQAARLECHLPIVSPGAILVGLTGEGRTRGMATLLGIEATINQHLAFVQPDEHSWDSNFLLWLMRSLYRDLREISDANGSTKGGLTVSQLRGLRIVRPPLADQRRIAALLGAKAAEVSQIICTAERGIDLARERRAALISAAVTGKIDVGVSA